MMRTAPAFAMLCALVVAVPATALAETDSYVHVVRPSETLASIAQRYYGDPRRESVLVAENGLTDQGGSAIVVGMRLVIPWVTHHVVRAGETWANVAERFYGDATRQFLLLEANDGTAGEQPDEGAELVIPYPLRHITGQNETLRHIGVTYFRSESPETIRRLRRFNDMRGMRPSRGQVILVPLTNLALSEEGRRTIEESTGRSISGGETRTLQQRIDDQLPELSEHVRRGRYTEAVGLGNRLLGAGQLTGNQVVTIQRELATAYVALGRHDLAVEAFKVALGRQSDLEQYLVPSLTSPTVLRAFAQAREQLRVEQEAATVQRDAGAGDAGETEPQE